MNGEGGTLSGQLGGGEVYLSCELVALKITAPPCPVTVTKAPQPSLSVEGA